MLAVTGESSHLASKPVGVRVSVRRGMALPGVEKCGALPDILLLGDRRTYVLQMHGLIVPSGEHHKFDAIEARFG